MTGIFISYRREDSSGYAGRIFDRLREAFGKDRVFMDVSAIEPGVDFVEAIDHAVGSCAALIVVIGKKWLTCTDAAGRRRLDDPQDFIRLETATALRRNIRVIPVLVQDAPMPRDEDLPEELKKLARRQATEIGDTHWDTDMEQLIGTLHGLLGTTPAPREKTIPTAVPERTAEKPSRTKSMVKVVGLMIAGAIVLLVVAGILNKKETPPVTIAPTEKAPQSPAIEQQAPAPRQNPPEPVNPADSAREPVRQRPATIAGRWRGSDGLTYQVQQQGNVIVMAGGYPNQAVIVTGRGMVSGKGVEVEFLRADAAMGKAMFTITDNARSMEGRYQTTTGEWGSIILRRY